MANYVDEKVASFDSVFDEALKCLEKASSIASTVVTLTDCRLEDIECANINSYLRILSNRGFCEAISIVNEKKKTNKIKNKNSHTVSLEYAGLHQTIYGE